MLAFAPTDINAVNRSISPYAGPYSGLRTEFR